MTASVAEIRDRLERGLAWTAFEPNGEPLWARVRAETDDVLLGYWRNGDLVGAKPEEAFFVRCDRTTMTQTDLDADRLILLAGIAVVKPAEFEPIRIERVVGRRRRCRGSAGVARRSRRSGRGGERHPAGPARVLGVRERVLVEVERVLAGVDLELDAPARLVVVDDDRGAAVRRLQRSDTWAGPESRWASSFGFGSNVRRGRISSSSPGGRGRGGRPLPGRDRRLVAGLRAVHTGCECRCGRVGRASGAGRPRRART